MSENELTELIDRIKERRLKLDMSYQDLSDATGISKSTLQRYETGYIKKVPINQIEILAKALHTTPSYLMGWDDNMMSRENTSYYINPETAALAQQIHDDPNLRILMDASRKLAPEDVQFVIDMVTRLKQKENGSDEGC